MTSYESLTKHPWVEDLSTYKAIIINPQPNSEWTGEASIRAFSTFGFDHVDSIDEGQLFSHNASGIQIIFDGVALAIQHNDLISEDDPNVTTLYNDICTALYQGFGWKEGVVFETFPDDILMEICKQIPAQYASDFNLVSGTTTRPRSAATPADALIAQLGTFSADETRAMGRLTAGEAGEGRVQSPAFDLGAMPPGLGEATLSAPPPSTHASVDDNTLVIPPLTDFDSISIAKDDNPQPEVYRAEQSPAAPISAPDSLHDLVIPEDDNFDHHPVLSAAPLQHHYGESETSPDSRGVPDLQAISITAEPAASPVPAAWPTAPETPASATTASFMAATPVPAAPESSAIALPPPVALPHPASEAKDNAAPVPTLPEVAPSPVIECQLNHCKVIFSAPPQGTAGVMHFCPGSPDGITWDVFGELPTDANLMGAAHNLVLELSQSLYPNSGSQSFPVLALTVLFAVIRRHSPAPSLPDVLEAIAHSDSDNLFASLVQKNPNAEDLELPLRMMVSRWSISHAVDYHLLLESLAILTDPVVARAFGPSENAFTFRGLAAASRPTTLYVSVDTQDERRLGPWRDFIQSYVQNLSASRRCPRPQPASVAHGGPVSAEGGEGSRVDTATSRALGQNQIRVEDLVATIMKSIQGAGIQVTA